jgi:FdhD protein
MAQPPAIEVSRAQWRGGALSAGSRCVPEETPVALTYNGAAHAVMMATPADLADFAVGFSLSEGVIEAPSEIASLDIVEVEGGVEARMWLAQAAEERHKARRRTVLGPSGCGLCGVESIAEALKACPRVGGGEVRIARTELIAAMEAFQQEQALNSRTRAVHAAGLWLGLGENDRRCNPSPCPSPYGRGDAHSAGAAGLPLPSAFARECGHSEVASSPRRACVGEGWGEGRFPGLIREDVGRHNALDKVIGAAALAGLSAAAGVVLLTSRVSVELVQKTARLGAPIIAAVSAPTALAIRIADAAGITLVALLRGDDFEIFTQPERITGEASSHAA